MIRFVSILDEFSDPLKVRIGLISDTHGLLRPEALEALRGCAQIIHAGDVGKAGLLETLAAIAPVTAVRGNVDRGPWAAELPATAVVRAGSARIYVIHDRADLDPEAVREAGARAVVFGHSHQPSIEEHDGTLFINPGAAGPRRFRLPISVGVLHVAEDDRLRAELISLG